MPSTRRRLTLLLLWEEYRERHPDGVGYSWFCEIYRAWKSRLTPTMRQTHIAGERMLVDKSESRQGRATPPLLSGIMSAKRFLLQGMAA